MTNRIEDYALIGNGETSALVGRDGSIDWMGMPRFDSPSCFTALLGTKDHGRWLIGPAGNKFETTRSYQADTLILQTVFEESGDAVRLIDFMALHEGMPVVVRLIEGIRGSFAMKTELVIRYDYGRVVPWAIKQKDGRIFYMAGPECLALSTIVPLHGENLATVGVFTVKQGEAVSFVLTWSPSYRASPMPPAVLALRDQTQHQWTQWAARLKPSPFGAKAVKRSLLTLKALAHWETGGIVAAATTSLPEKIGGQRNWDYRYCWLRDATLTLYAFIGAGVIEEAEAWRSWLIRAVAGNPADLQTLYGVAGERHLEEYELSHLPGYEGSIPVRVGNAAQGQIQLDIYGEIMDTLYLGRCAGLGSSDAAWGLECALMTQLESIWDEPDDGIWEVRGGRKHFTHSKVMAWVAFDRAIRSATEFGLEGPVEHWRTLRARIHENICTHAYDQERDTFVQSYGSTSLDASLLLMAINGFLPADDSRMKGTIKAIETHLVYKGLVLRYDSSQTGDGLPAGEGAFLACSFWLADNYVLQGRLEEAQSLFERLLGYCNDVGLLAEEYDPVSNRQLGNFPQAFSHLALINTAHNLTGAGPAHHRSGQVHPSGKTVLDNMQRT